MNTFGFDNNLDRPGIRRPLLFWIPMIIVQFKAFSKGLTPYPGRAKWFNIFVGAAPGSARCFCASAMRSPLAGCWPPSLVRNASMNSGGV